jgi:hypothetical protein
VAVVVEHRAVPWALEELQLGNQVTISIEEKEEDP